MVVDSNAAPCVAITVTPTLGGFPSPGKFGGDHSNARACTGR